VACVIGPSVNPFQNWGNSTYEKEKIDLGFRVKLNPKP